MKTPYIVDIKDNSLDDGVGIRSVVFFKGCPLHCVWCQNPEAQNPNQELVYQPAKCIQCRPSCFVNCPNGAFDYRTLKLNRDKCKLSWECVKNCPAGIFSKAGKKYNIDDLVQKFSSNIVFYNNSNGGVTLSGGEPMLYPDYTLNLVTELRSKEIDIAIETCGLFDYNSQTKKILEQVQHLYFDIKFINPNLHKRYCGVDNTKILQNFKSIVTEGKIKLPSKKIDLEIPTMKPYLIPRIPLIPNIVSDPKNLREIAQFLLDFKIKMIDILPYNPLWIDKARTIGQNVKYNRDTWMSSEEIADAAEIFQRFEFDTFTQ